jgi:hypothetical protein
MENEKLDALLKSFAALVSPYILEQMQVRVLLEDMRIQIREEVRAEVQKQVDDLGQIDKEMIAEVVRSELSDLDIVTSDDLDDRLIDYATDERVTELAAEAIEEKLDDMIGEAVLDALKYKITFSVEAH